MEGRLRTDHVITECPTGSRAWFYPREGVQAAALEVIIVMCGRQTAW